jgi:hypothetical protein
MQAVHPWLRIVAPDGPHALLQARPIEAAQAVKAFTSTLATLEAAVCP